MPNTHSTTTHPAAPDVITQGDSDPESGGTADGNVGAAHAQALAARRTKAAAIRYACDVLGKPTTAGVQTWLERYGVVTSRSNTSTVVNAWRRERGMADTGDLPAFTDEVLTELAARSNTTERGEAAVRAVSAPTDAPFEHPANTESTVFETPQRLLSDASGTRSDTPEGALGFYLVAAMSLLVSADTSWRLFGWLGITAPWERAALFSVMEAALIACGFAMRAQVRRTGRPGPARVLAWTLCGVAVFGAVALSGPVAGALRVLLGPALGLVALHLALGIEIRAREQRMTYWARLGRELRERALSRLGLADDERDALARTRDRAARRAARLALAPQWTLFRRTRLDRALRASNVAHDDGCRSRMLAELAAVRHAAALTTLEQRSPWSS